MTSEVATWRKSTFSSGGGTGGGNCVEAAKIATDQFALRDSKAPEAGALLLPRSGMTALLTAITAYRVARSSERATRIAEGWRASCPGG